MKIAKDLLKIAHELDESGLYDLADSIDSLAVKLAFDLNELKKQQLADLAKRDMSQIKPPLPKNLDIGPEIKDFPAEQGRPRTPSDWSESAQKAEREIHKERMKLDKKLRAEFDKELRKSPGWEKANAAQRKEIIEAAKARVRGAMANLQEGARSVGEAAGKAKAYRADPSNSWKTGLKGAKPGMVSGLLGGAVGAHAGATIGEAIGGDTGKLVGGIVGGVAGGTVAGTPVGKALLAGWVIGTAINEAGLGDAIQQALSAKEDASAEAGQLKDMIEIFDKTAKIIDHPATPMETKVKKYLNIENLINNIIKHPAALPVLGQDGVEKFRGLKAKMDADVAAAASSAPAVMEITTEELAAAKAPRKAAPSPAIRQLQVNLNKLNEAGKTPLPAKLVEDGLVGKYTRGAISAFDPASGGRVTRDLLKRVSDAAANAGSVESDVAPDAAPPMSVAAPFIPNTPMMQGRQVMP